MNLTDHKHTRAHKKGRHQAGPFKNTRFSDFWRTAEIVTVTPAIQAAPPNNQRQAQTG